MAKCVVCGIHGHSMAIQLYTALQHAFSRTDDGLADVLQKAGEQQFERSGFVHE